MSETQVTAAVHQWRVVYTLVSEPTVRLWRNFRDGSDALEFYALARDNEAVSHVVLAKVLLEDGEPPRARRCRAGTIDGLPPFRSLQELARRAREVTCG